MIEKFDNFAPDFKEVRDHVIHGGFSSQTGPDGAIYTGISGYSVPQWFDRIADLLGCPIMPKLSCFRLNLEGELPHSWVHSDDICATYASVLYMNEPQQCFGGTAFWKHSVLGIDRLPKRETLENPDKYYKQIEKDWKEIDWWEQIKFMPMRSNRFVTYPTCLFHSRFPFEGFGKDAKDGRLIWICFYDRKEDA